MVHTPPPVTVFPNTDERSARTSHDSSRRSYEYDSTGRRRGSTSTYRSTGSRPMVAVETKPPFTEKVRRFFGMQPKRYVAYTPALSTPAGTSMATYKVAPRTTGTTTYHTTGNGYNTYPTTSRTYAYATQPRTYNTGGYSPSRQVHIYPSNTGGTTYHRSTRSYSPSHHGHHHSTIYPSNTGGTTRTYRRTTRTTRY